MDVLIDGVPAKIDRECYQIKDGSRVAWHRSLHLKGSMPENSRVVGGGHLYVVNYNAETYKAKFPQTFEGFLLNGNKF